MTEYTFNLSILEDNPNALDVYEPASFLTWLNNKNIVSADITILFNSYKDYIVAWGKKKTLNKQKISETLRDSYIQVLRDIVINFSTEEERRFVLNANFGSSLDLDIVLPFFIKKLKQICLYFVTQRENLKTAKVQHNLKGSNFGLEVLVQKVIYDAANTSQYLYTDKTSKFPPVSALANDLSVYVEELFDTTADYFNINPDNVSDKFNNISIERQSLSSSNINSIDSNLYLNFKQAVIDAIQQYPFFINSLGLNNFSVNPVLSGTELYYLKNRDFINYLSGGSADLKLNLQKRLAPKYMGNDFYYLSTGTTTTNYISGLLFSVQPAEGSATLNLLNRNYPTVATVPNLNSLYSEREIGKFFIPTYLGLLIHNTPSKKFTINTNLIKPNTVYVFPDPAVVGNVSYNSDTEHENYPLVYQIDLSWNKYPRSDCYLFGDVVSDSYKQLYYGYESQQQDLQKDVSGLAKYTDNVEFWSGEKDTVWTNSDRWPDLRTAEELDYAARQQSLLVQNDYSLVKWGSDVFNNEYGLLKRIEAAKNIENINIQQGILPGSSTVLLSSSPMDVKSLYVKKNTEPGYFYFRNNFTSLVMPASAALSAIYLKYPDIVKTELNNKIFTFNIYGDILLIETESYVIVDKINFDLESTRVISNSLPGNYFVKFNINNQIESFINEWYDEYNDILYLAFLKQLPLLSASNYKTIYPAIYKAEGSKLSFKQVYPNPTNSLFAYYSLSAGFIDPPQIDVRKVHGAYFSRVEKTNTFDITYLAKNNNSIPFFVNEQFIQTEPYLTSIAPKLFKPFYFIYDNNYANPQLPFLVKYNASSSGIMGYHDNANMLFDTGFKDSKKITYMYNDGVAPIQINDLGSYIVQFDWESYDTANLFIGCSSYLVKNVGNNIIWNYGSPDAVVLDVLNESTRVNTLCYFTLDEKLTSYSDTWFASGTLLNAFSSDPNTAIPYFTITAYHADYRNLSDYDLDSFKNVKNDHSIRYKLSTFDFFWPSVGDYPNYVADNTTRFNIHTGFGYVPDAIRYFPVGTPIYFYIYNSGQPKFNYAVNVDATRPVYPDPSILQVNVSTVVNPFSSNPSVSAELCQPPYTIYNSLDITLSGSGKGRVFTDPFCVTCGDNCTQSFASNTSLTLIASAARASSFEGWAGGSCDGSVFEDCSFNITNNTSVTAMFKLLPIYSISVFNVAGKVVSLDGLISCPNYCYYNNYIQGDVVTLSALQSLSGYIFKSYSGGPCEGELSNICSFYALNNYSITANYVRYYDYTVSVQLSASPLVSFPSYGRVISIPAGIDCPVTSCSITVTGSQDSVVGATQLTLSANAIKGYNFIGWEGTPCTGTTNNTCTFNVTNDYNVKALYDLGYYTLTVLFSGEGIGTFFSDDLGVAYTNATSGQLVYFPVLNGRTFTFYLSALSGNTVEGIFGSTCQGIGVSACIITMSDDTTITAVITSTTFYVLSVLKLGTACGTVSSLDGKINFGHLDNARYASGATPTLTVSALPVGCTLEKFIGNGTYFVYESGYGISMDPSFTLNSGDYVSLVDGSILISDAYLGAPYSSGDGINISTMDCRVNMTDNRTVSAIFL